MRLAIVAALVLACALALPGARASPSALELAVPSTDVAGGETVPVTVRLTVEKFACFQDRTFLVEIAATGSEGVKPLLAQEKVRFPVQPYTYYVERYQREVVVDLSVRAIRSGTLDLQATFQADVGPCHVPGGFDPASASLSLSVEPAPPSDPTPEPTPGTPPAPTPETPPSPTPTPPPTPGGSRTCNVEGQCGYIGDFETAAEARGVPGPALVLMLVAIAGAAGWSRRKA